MPAEASDSFDLKKFQALVELMDKHDLREVKLRGGDQKWTIRRGPQEVISAVPAAMPAPFAAAAAAPAPVAPAVPEAAPAADDGTTQIKSPMVGTVYRAPSPDDPPFVKEGDRVTPDTVVCLVEAMKFFNQIKAETTGTIVKVLVSDGDPVDYGQGLFKVKPE